VCTADCIKVNHSPRFDSQTLHQILKLAQKAQVVKKSTGVLEISCRMHSVPVCMFQLDILMIEVLMIVYNFAQLLTFKSRGVDKLQLSMI
jgi:hypothetical protein